MSGTKISALFQINVPKNHTENKCILDKSISLTARKAMAHVLQCVAMCMYARTAKHVKWIYRGHRDFLRFFLALCSTFFENIDPQMLFCKGLYEARLIWRRFRIFVFFR